ncbi:probable protein ABIL4 [Impatiens glandulifera]|uniref:probable protein ABIL4 n=1 Tax=Impatiens glandulifera TaxID=253017 RepID=UPI001FB1028B|nr:probable protein ABIL4 [Impatiens glandulifera]
MKSSTIQNQTEQMQASESRFFKSLQELKELSSQLHYAADYSEKSYLNGEEKKKIVLKNTKDYICKALVTVIDHVGCVSTNLDFELSKETAISEAEFGIVCLNQRLITLQQYFHKLETMKHSWINTSPRYHSRYIVPPMQEDLDKPNDMGFFHVHNGNSNKLKKSIRYRLEAAKEFEANEVPLFLYTVNMKKTCLSKHSSLDSNDPTLTQPMLPVRDSLSSSSFAKNRTPSFHFQDSSPTRTKRNIVSLLLFRKNK